MKLLVVALQNFLLNGKKWNILILKVSVYCLCRISLHNECTYKIERRTTERNRKLINFLYISET